jgi:hypothetical protein
MVNYQYLAGALALLVLAWLGLRAVGRSSSGANISILLKRSIVGVIATLTTRILIQDSGLDHSDVTLLAIPIGTGLAFALIYRG